MGVVDLDGGKRRQLPGYKILDGPRKTKKFIYKCSNRKTIVIFLREKADYHYTLLTTIFMRKSRL